MPRGPQKLAFAPTAALSAFAAAAFILPTLLVFRPPDPGAFTAIGFDPATALTTPRAATGAPTTDRLELGTPPPAPLELGTPPPAPLELGTPPPAP
ncbi:MAG: hypothetical protein MUF34_17775 [Polyangiaceae bacterium]|nr:hypothetical protein [Polyangiaceae bacterium]